MVLLAPLKVSVDEEKEQEMCEGKAPQARPTGPAYPPTEATESVDVPEPPLWMVSVVGLAAALTAGAVTTSETAAEVEVLKYCEGV